MVRGGDANLGTPKPWSHCGMRPRWSCSRRVLRESSEVDSALPRRVSDSGALFCAAVRKWHKNQKGLLR